MIQMKQKKNKIDPPLAELLTFINFRGITRGWEQMCFDPLPKIVP